MSHSPAKSFAENLRRAIGPRSLKDLSQSLSPGGYDWLRRIVSRGLDRISKAREPDLAELCRQLGIEPHQLWRDATPPTWQQSVTIADLLQLGAERLAEVTGVEKLQILEHACLNSAVSSPVNNVFTEAFAALMRTERIAKLPKAKSVSATVEKQFQSLQERRRQLSKPEEPDVDPNDLDALLDAGIDPLTMQKKNPR